MSAPPRLLAVLAVAGVACGTPPPLSPPTFVDCQPLRDNFAFFDVAFAPSARMEPAGGGLTVAIALEERCELDLEQLRLAASLTGPDNLTVPLTPRVFRQTTPDGRPRLVEAVDVTLPTPGWWLVELSLDPGWARHQVLVYAMENRAGAARRYEATGQDVSACLSLQRTTGGTFVCDTGRTSLHSRPGVPVGDVGGPATVVGDVAWASDGARVLRFEDSPTGLRTVASAPGSMRVEQVETARALVSDFDPAVRARGAVVGRGRGPRAGEVSSGFTAVMADGGLVELCPGPACEDIVVGLHGGVLVTMNGLSGVTQRVPLDGGAAQRLDLGPGRLAPLSTALVDGRPLAVQTPWRRTALLLGLGGTPRVVWLGDDVVGVGDGVALLRGRARDEVAVVPLDF